MDKNPFAPDFKDLPENLPIFPLAGVLLLPGGNLPLNVFEPRYLAMVSDTLAGHRLIGMVQPTIKTADFVKDDAAVFNTGCAGKITEFSETIDGRFLITLTGVSRFDIVQELPLEKGYRRVKAEWKAYENDATNSHCLGLDREKLKSLLQKYFKNEGMDCDWGKLDGTPDGKLITCLSMVCPLDGSEKQALLEAECGKTRAKMFMTMLEIAICGGKECKSQH